MALAVVPAVAITFLGGCGVPAEPRPRPLPSEAMDVIRGTEPSDTAGPGALIELWFVRDNRLVPTDRQSDVNPTSEQALSLLEAGPTLEEKQEGLRTAQVSVVPGTRLAVTADEAGLSVPVRDGQVAVVLSDRFSDLPSQEQLLILGQIVLTLAVEPDETVLFVNSTGTPVGVPLPNGRLSSGAVNASNYSALTQ
jgi:hypothetical protein